MVVSWVVSYDKEMILSYWRILPRVEFGKNSMLKAAEFANENNFLQSGIGLMDAIIIKSVIDGNHTLWTLDKKIHNIIDRKYIFRQIIE